MTSDFAYCTCQPGAEPLLKGEVAERLPAWRFAFSRPGFVTFRLPRPADAQRFEPLRLTFARTTGVSLDRVEAAGDDTVAAAAAVWELDRVRQLVADGPVGLHVWRRDAALPGEDGVEPGPTDETRAAYETLVAAAPEGAIAASGEARRRLTLDIAIVDPGKWWVGAHAVRSRTDRWPGGVPPLVAPEHAVSRAYLKMQEGLRWSAPPARKGDKWIELGCAPGGASQALLDAGMRVIGVDPAEVDPIVATHPCFTHLRHRSAEVPLAPLRDAAWLTADVNAAPSYTLNAVESIVTNASTNIRGLVLTMKLLSPELARPERVAEVIDWVRSWGYEDVRTRQLAFNRREYCLAALPSRGQRRMKRRRQQSRPTADQPETPSEASSDS
ncbi:MAG: SAM-dependent methyltransferase [Planctomycetota bacterium]